VMTLTNGLVGVGTTTPVYNLTIASTTAPQLALSAGAGVAQWTFRNAGGDFFLSTTTVAGTATTTTSALTIIGSTGNVGVATTSPWRTLSVVGTMAINGLSAVATGDSAVCLSAGGEVRVNTGVSTCTVSSRQFKHDIATSSLSALDLVNAMRPVTYIYNGDATNSEHFGFIAEEVDLLEPRLVARDIDGMIRSVRYEEMTSVLTKALQELDLKIEDLASTIPPQTGSFGERLFTQIFAQVRIWLADVGNGVGSVFAGTFRASAEICVDDQCLNKEDVRALLALARSASSTPVSEVTVDMSVPVISITGNNPGVIQVGTSYVDLGATVTDMGINPLDPSGPLVENNNLGLHYSVNGVSMNDISIDTSILASSTPPSAACSGGVIASSTCTHTIVFSAVDQAGNWGYATRTVEVIPVQ